MKKLKKILLLVSVLAMVIGQTLTVSAAATAVIPKVTTMTAYDNAGKRASAVTFNVTDKVADSDTRTLKVTYQWTKSSSDTLTTAELKVLPQNRGVVLAEVVSYGTPEQVKVDTRKNITTYKTTAILKLTAVNNGKTKVVISDANNAKKKLNVNVTVNILADKVNVDDEITVAAGGKVTLPASVFSDNGAVTKNGVTYKSADNKMATVTGKGVISAKKTAGDVKITVTSKDKNVSKDVLVHIVNADVTNLKIVDPSATNAKKQKVNALNITLKTNAGKNAYETLLDITPAAGKKVSKADLVFTTSKASVAIADENGVITAVGNGTAKITVTPKLGNNVKVTYTVKVTTDVDTIVAPKEMTILANGKVNKIDASVNALASNKKITYTVEDVKDMDGKAVAKADWKKYITANTRGVSAKKPCVATITVAAGSAKVGDYMTKGLTVTAIEPVNKITFNENNRNSLTYNVVRTESGAKLVSDKDVVSMITLAGKNCEPSTKDVAITSNKPGIVEVREEEGKYYLYAKANGKAVITILAADGNKAKATLAVNVKTDVYSLDVKNTVVEGENEVLYIEAGKKTDLKKVLAAYVNGDASTKTVKYSKTSITLAAGASETITITAGAKSKQVLVKAAEKVAADYTITLSESAIALKKGEKCADVTALVSAKDDGTVLHQMVTWKSNNTRVAAVDKNGVVTAKGVGVATITATYQGFANVTASYEVTVGRSDAEVKKDIDKLFTDTLKAENRDYLGAKVVFKAKTASFDVDITAPDTVVADWKDTGLLTTVKEFPATIYGLVITNNANGEVWGVDREGLGVVITEPDGTEVAFNTNEEGIEYLKNGMLAVYPTLKDWNGASYTVSVLIKEQPDNKAFEYVLDYAVDASIKAALYENIADDRVAAAVAELSASEVPSLSDIGVASVVYDKASNTMVIDVTDSSMGIADADMIARDLIVETMNATFTDATNVTVVLTKNETVLGQIEKSKVAGEASDEYINALLDKYLETTASKAYLTYSDLANAKITAKVVYTVGGLNYTASYEIILAVDKTARDAEVDEAIEAAIGAYEFGEVEYIADTNTANVMIYADAKDLEFNAISNTGLIDALKEMVANEAVTKAEIVGVNGQVSALTGADLTDKLTVFKAVIGGDMTTKVGSVDGKSVTVKVIYGEGDKAFSISYTVNFALEVVEEVAEVEEIPAEEAPVEEAPVEEAPIEETPVEEAPVEETPVEEAPVEEVPVEEVPAA